MYKMYTDRLNKLLARDDITQALARGEVRSVLERLGLADKIALSLGIAEVNENPFKQWGFVYTDKTSVDLKTALEHFLGIVDNFLERGNWLGNIDGTQISSSDTKTLHSRIMLAKILGFDVYSTQQGYWGDTPDAIVLKPGYNLRGWFYEFEEDGETYEEWFNRVKPKKV